MASIAVLQKRRAQLQRRYNGYAASADKHLEAYVDLRVKQRALANQISDLDDTLDARLDHRLEVIDTVQLESGEYDAETNGSGEPKPVQLRLILTEKEDDDIRPLRPLEQRETGTGGDDSRSVNPGFGKGELET